MCLIPLYCPRTSLASYSFMPFPLLWFLSFKEFWTAGANFIKLRGKGILLWRLVILYKEKEFVSGFETEGERHDFPIPPQCLSSDR